MLKFISFAATGALAQTGEAWDFKQNGRNWPNLEIVGNQCGGSNQSPIDLKTTGWPTMAAKNDKFFQLYTNVNNATVSFNGYTSKIMVNNEK